MILYGTNPTVWSNDDDQSIGTHLSLEDCLSDCQTISLDGIEKSHKMPMDGDDLKAVLGGYGLWFIGGWHSTNIPANGLMPETEKAAMDAHIAMSKAAGSDVIALSIWWTDGAMGNARVAGVQAVHARRTRSAGLNPAIAGRKPYRPMRPAPKQRAAVARSI